ncbi:hypothetical protein [Streptomyces collinus]|uniref:hypothetical protein n=1 Tax=Streptomyces collinus TaxID=42684 RepID=UPI00363D4EAB
MFLLLQQGRRELVVAAQSFASAPGVAEALRSPDPTVVLQPRAEEARKGAGVDFVVAMNTEGMRYTYPYTYTLEIGKRFVSTIGPALGGPTVVEQAGRSPPAAGKGTAVQAVVPVTDAHDNVVGLVSAGITVKNVAALRMPESPRRPDHRPVSSTTSRQVGADTVECRQRMRRARDRAAHDHM